MRSLEAKGTFPRPRLGVMDNGKGQLIFVAIPRSEQMDSLDIWRCSEGERKLHGRSRHLCCGMYDAINDGACNGDAVIMENSGMVRKTSQKPEMVVEL